MSFFNFSISQQDKKNRKTPFNKAECFSRAVTCVGRTCLSELLSSYALKTKGDAALKVGVVGKYHQKAIKCLVLVVYVNKGATFFFKSSGFPNVGKSSVINSMKEVLACTAGVKRGITK